jgi:hypothetical protein
MLEFQIIWILSHRITNIKFCKVCNEKELVKKKSENCALIKNILTCSPFLILRSHTCTLAWRTVPHITVFWWSVAIQYSVESRGSSHVPLLSPVLRHKIIKLINNKLCSITSMKWGRLRSNIDTYRSKYMYIFTMSGHERLNLTTIKMRMLYRNINKYCM